MRAAILALALFSAAAAAPSQLVRVERKLRDTHGERESGLARRFSRRTARRAMEASVSLAPGASALSLIHISEPTRPY